MKPFTGTFAKLLRGDGFNGIPTSYLLLNKFFVKGDKETPTVTERLKENDSVEIRGGEGNVVIKPPLENLQWVRDHPGIPIYDNLVQTPKTGILKAIYESGENFLLLTATGVERYVITTDVSTPLSSVPLSGLIGMHVFNLVVYVYNSTTVYKFNSTTNVFDPVRPLTGGHTFRSSDSSASKLVLTATNGLHVLVGLTWSLFEYQYHEITYSVNPLAVPVPVLGVDLPTSLDPTGVPNFIATDLVKNDKPMWGVAIQTNGEIWAATTRGIAKGQSNPLQVNFLTYNNVDHSGDILFMESNTFYHKHAGVWVGMPEPATDFLVASGKYFKNEGGLSRWWPAQAKAVKVFNQTGFKQIVFKTDQTNGVFIKTTGEVFKIKNTPGDVVLFKIRVTDYGTSRVAYKIEKFLMSRQEFLDKTMDAIAPSLLTMTSGVADYLIAYHPTNNYWGAYGNVDRILREVMDEGKGAGLSLDGK